MPRLKGSDVPSVSYHSFHADRLINHTMYCILHIRDDNLLYILS